MTMNLDEAKRLTRAALSEVYTEEGVEIWLHAPNRRFGGRTAMECIESGQGEAVVSVARYLTGEAW
jgi:hypothetical protein